MRLPALALAALVFSFPTAALADQPVPTISLSATGNSIVVPDMAELSLSVVREAATAREALDANNAAMAEVLAAMKEAGVAERDLQTSQFSIQPQYRYFQPNQQGVVQPPEITGYQVTNGLTVRVRALENVGAVLDRAVTLGVNSGGGINFTTSRPEAALEQARKDAVERAMAKARTLTETAGVGLGRIVNISEQGGRQPRMKQMARMAEASLARDMAVPVAAGEGSYSVTVSISWEIAQ